ncbi:MAG: hypothetical protein M3Z22_05465 [Verrucomicrobiota bacterium]|nr:hypothetical protein [Verrucomicrobiota bacterium]
MKINWFSPLSPAGLEAAQCSAAILARLTDRAEVVLWREGSETVSSRGFDLRKPLPWRQINHADVTIYHIGDDAHAYGGIWAISREHPGVVVLHDITMQRLLAGLVMQKRLGQAEYLRLADFHDPANGRALAASFLRGKISLEELGQRSPLTGAAIENALAVVVHTQAAFDRLVEEVSIPIVLIPSWQNDDARASADALLEVADGVANYQRLWSARTMARRAGGIADSLFAGPEAGDLLPRVAQEIAFLSDDRPFVAQTIR